MEWRNEEDTNVTYDYSGNHYEYIDEDDYYFVSHKEVACKQQISDWEQEKIHGDIERTCPPFWDRYEHNISTWMCPVTIKNPIPLPSFISV